MDVGAGKGSYSRRTVVGKSVCFDKGSFLTTGERAEGSRSGMIGDLVRGAGLLAVE